MKALLIGGTGTISRAVAQLLARKGWELSLLNRGSRSDLVPEGARLLKADVSDEQSVRRLLEGEHFDVVADFIAYGTDDLERDYRLFDGRTDQFIYISSASVYRKPLTGEAVNENTPVSNPYWQYARDKIAGEEYLMERCRSDGFPATIVRPSHTYGEEKIPLGVHGGHSWQVARRILEGKPVLIHGDGTSLWALTHNSDFARGFAGLMGNIQAIGETVQITTDEQVTWNRIYEVIAQALEKPLHAVHVASDFLASCRPPVDLEGTLLGDKAHSVLFDNAKLKRLVPGFEARVRMEQGITGAVRHILSHPEWQQADPVFDAWCDRVIASLDAVRVAFEDDSVCTETK